MHSRMESKSVHPSSPPLYPVASFSLPSSHPPFLAVPGAAENYADGGEKLW